MSRTFDSKPLVERYALFQPARLHRESRLASSGSLTLPPPGYQGPTVFLGAHGSWLSRSLRQLKLKSLTKPERNDQTPGNQHLSPFYGLTGCEAKSLCGQAVPPAKLVACL
jgi:hypothetical protein